MTLKKLICGLALVVLVGTSLSSTVQASPRSGKSVTKYVDMLNRRGSVAFVYKPAVLVVHVGTRVVWRNRSSQPHSVTPTGKQLAFDVSAPVASGAKEIESKRQWSFVFRRPGMYAYYCEFHPYMKGKVIVTK